MSTYEDNYYRVEEDYHGYDNDDDLDSNVGADDIRELAPRFIDTAMLGDEDVWGDYTPYYITMTNP